MENPPEFPQDSCIDEPKIKEYKVRIDYVGTRDTIIVVHCSNEEEALDVAEYMFRRSYTPKTNTISIKTILGKERA